MESYPPCCPSGLSQGTIPSKTNKHNHFKQTEVKPPDTLTEKRKSIKKKKTLEFCYKEDKFAPRGPLTR